MRDTQRPSWDEYFLKLAFEVSKRSTCLRRAVGAIIVKDRRILATGYNGVPAEQNAIIQAARYGIDIEGSSIYITTEPCSVCAKMLINAGIKEIVFATAYPDKLSEELLGETDILIRCVEYSE